jgi:hypothetical protein
MATQLSEAAINPDVTQNASYINFLNDARALPQLEKDFENSNISNTNNVAAKNSDGTYSQAFMDYATIVTNDPASIQNLYTNTQATITASGITYASELPKPVAKENETNVRSGMNNYIVTTMKAANPSLADKTNAQILNTAAQMGMMRLLTYAYSNTTSTAITPAAIQSIADTANKTVQNTQSTLTEAFANYAVQNFKKDYPALAKNLSNSQILGTLEQRQDGTVFKTLASNFKKENPTLSTTNINNEKKDIKLQADITPTNTATQTIPTTSTTPNAVAKTFDNLGIDKTTTSNIAADYAKRNSGGLSPSEKNTFKEAMVQAELLKAVQNKNKGGTITKEQFVAMANTPAEKEMAAKVFDNISGNQNTITGFLAKDMGQGGLIETVKEAVKNPEKDGGIIATQQQTNQQNVRARA